MDKRDLINNLTGQQTPKAERPNENAIQRKLDELQDKLYRMNALCDGFMWAEYKDYGTTVEEYITTFNEQFTLALDAWFDLSKELRK